MSLLLIWAGAGTAGPPVIPGQSAAVMITSEPTSLTSTPKGATMLISDPGSATNSGKHGADMETSSG